MSVIADRFRSRAAAFSERVQAVRDDRWQNPSPCEGWTARDVVDHVAGNAGRFFALIDREPPVTPAAADDPVAAWHVNRDALQNALDDPAIATLPYQSTMMGSGTFEEAVDQFGNLDVLVHTWDLARAVGGDERLDPQEVAQALDASKPMDEMLRSSGACGPKLTPPEGADEQTQLLAFFGRRA